MKKYLSILVVISIVSCTGEKKAYFDEILKHRLELDAEFSNPETSPLLAEDLSSFKGLDYFEIDPSLKIVAKFIRTEYEETFGMPTTTDRLPKYKKYGEAFFEFAGKRIRLNIYQNIELVKKEEYKKYLFLPYKDLTCGKESYGGGKYIDLKIPEGDELVIDFNLAYNPYCAYNSAYSCPIPPAENHLEVEVRGGAKTFH